MSTGEAIEMKHEQGGIFSGAGTTVGCVWDKVATEWAGDEDWICKRARCQAIQGKRRFVTHAMKSVNHSTIHRTRTGKKKNDKAEDKAPRILGPADKTIHIREEGPTVQLCGDSEVAGKWINGQYALGQKYRGRFGQIHKTVILMVDKKKRTSYLKDRRLRET